MKTGKPSKNETLVAGRIGIVLLLALALSWPSQAPAASPLSGKRALLDGEISAWTRSDGIDRALARAKRAGFNVYVPTVWQGRGTTWPSKFAPWDVELRDRPKEGFDPLRSLIAKAHGMGMEVHVWLTLMLRQADIFPAFALPDSAEPAFNVHDPAFRALLVSLIEELAVNYPVDGINLDYVRAVDVCVTPRCQEEYRAKYDRNLQVDAVIFKVSPSLVPTLADYQRSAVTELVAAIAQRVRKARPGIVISMDALMGHPSLTQGQDAAAWVNGGLIDALLRMDYGRRLSADSLEATRRELRDPARQGVLISNMTMEDELGRGQKHYPREGTWLAERIAEIETRWPDSGLAVYFYNYLTDEQIEALRQGPFARSRRPPERRTSN